MSTTDNEIHLKLISLTFEGNYMFRRDIKDLTPVRGQDGHPRERFLVSNEAPPSWKPIEIFPAGI
jgi:hypothetical protein